MAGAWIAHIKKTRASMPKGTSYSAAMKKAATTWSSKKAGTGNKAPKGKKKRAKKR